MKLVNIVLRLIRNNLANKFLIKITIFFALSIFTFIVIIKPHFVLANIISEDLQQVIINKSMVNMEVRLENEYEKYFGKALAENGNLHYLPSSIGRINTYGIPPNRNRKIDTNISNKTSSEIAKDLAILNEKTNTKSAVMWVMPKEKFLHLVLLTAQGKITIKDEYSAPAKKLVATVTDFYLEINELNEPMDLTLAQQLYQWIIAPLEEEVLKPEKIDNILFCLGKGVRALPFAALHDGEKFAVEKYNMSRIPGFNLINLSYKSLRTPTVLAMGASDFNENDPLPGVSVELQNIVDRLQAQSTTTQEDVLFNQEFTLSNMQSKLQNKSFDIIHLATHADFNPGIPRNSYIQFWNEKLTLDKMSDFSWQTPPELLVLSACNTALGNEEAELGFTGIALQSGVKSALGSLWYVSDLGTLALITEFYEQLINQSEQNPTKIQSLTTAQNLLLEGKVYFEDNHLITPHGKIELPDDLGFEGNLTLSHPFYWASFTLISSPW